MEVFRLSVCHKIGQWRSIVRQLRYPYDVATFLRIKPIRPRCFQVPMRISQIFSPFKINVIQGSSIIEPFIIAPQLALALERAGSQVQRLLEGL